MHSYIITSYISRVSSRIFCLGGEDIVCKDQLCVKHAKFSSPFLSINHQCTKKKSRKSFCIKCQNFFGGGSWGEASPPHPPVDETLISYTLDEKLNFLSVL